MNATQLREIDAIVNVRILAKKPAGEVVTITPQLKQDLMLVSWDVLRTAAVVQELIEDIAAKQLEIEIACDNAIISQHWKAQAAESRKLLENVNHHWFDTVGEQATAATLGHDTEGMGAAEAVALVAAEGDV